MIINGILKVCETVVVKSSFPQLLYVYEPEKIRRSCMKLRSINNKVI